MSQSDKGSGSGLSRLIDGVGKVVDRMPGGTIVTRSARAMESSALGLLKERMGRLDGPAAIEGPRPTSARTTTTLQSLLDSALEQDKRGAERALYAQILGQLVPDEARLLSAMMGGAAYPLIHVMAAPRVGGSSRRLLDNVSNIGKKAGIQLLERGRYYIAHLRFLELAETSAEDESAHTEYQLLETDSLVREVLTHVEQKGPGTRARIVRRTLRMSAFGREFWDACRA